jgi:solute carrier family 25 phosphate transporter 23/24/25/41
MTTVAREEGFLALYKGLWPSIAGIFPYIGIDFAVYETLRTHIPQGSTWRNSHNEPRKHVLLGCGAIAGAVGQTIAYPLDLVRRRLQVQGQGRTTYEYSGKLIIATQFRYHILTFS